MTKSSIIVSTHRHREYDYVMTWQGFPQSWPILCGEIVGPRSISPSKIPMMRGPDGFFVVSFYKLLNELWIWRWFETHLRKGDAHIILQVVLKMTDYYDYHYVHDHEHDHDHNHDDDDDGDD